MAQSTPTVDEPARADLDFFSRTKTTDAGGPDAVERWICASAGHEPAAQSPSPGRVGAGRRATRPDVGTRPGILDEMRGAKRRGARGQWRGFFRRSCGCRATL